MGSENKQSSVCSLKFEKYFVDFIEFKRNDSYANNSAVSIDLNIGSSIEYTTENKAIVKLILKIFDDELNENIPFSMKVNISGIFVIDNPETDKLLIEQNALAILFPYARAIITNYTANANITPLILQPINVVNYINYKRKMLEENK